MGFYKRPQFAENIRLLGRGMNARDFYYFSRKGNRNFRRSCRQLSRIATKRQCSRARSAPPLPKNLTSLRFSGALFSHTCGFLKRGERTRFLLFFAQGKSQFSSERSAAFSHCHKAAMLACALRSSSSQKSHFVAIFGSPFSAPLFGNTLPLAGKVNARDFNTFLQKQKPRFLLLHFAPRGRCDGRG